MTDLRDRAGEVDTPGGSEWLVPAEVSATPTSRRSSKWMVFGATCVAIVGLLVLGGIGMWAIRQVNPPGAPESARTFVVAPGDDLVSVSKRLKAEGFITHAGVFQWYVKRKGGIRFAAGYYSLRPRDTVGNLVRALRTPPSATFTSVTFPEGFTVEQMALRLHERVDRLSAPAFDAATTDGSVASVYAPSGASSMEGLLFPDTYQVSNGETERQVVARMVHLMERVGRQEGMDDPLKRGGLTPYQVLIVASLIEREARFDVDRARIARVVYNRLALGMPLEIDASLRYGHDPAAPFSTLKALDTPYNTYLHIGLPPTPIAAPGRASIRAALNPSVDPSQGDPICRGLTAGAPCQYLYYVVSDKAGHHVFAATLAQHEANVERARQAGLLS
jgi:UPF0755 protein